MVIKRVGGANCEIYFGDFLKANQIVLADEEVLCQHTSSRDQQHEVGGCLTPVLR